MIHVIRRNILLKFGETIELDVLIAQEYQNGVFKMFLQNIWIFSLTVILIWDGYCRRDLCLLGF